MVFVKFHDMKQREKKTKILMSPLKSNKLLFFFLLIFSTILTKSRQYYQYVIN